VAGVILIAAGIGYVLGRGEGQRQTAALRPAPAAHTSTAPHVPAKPPRRAESARQPESEAAAPKPVATPERMEARNAEPKGSEVKPSEVRSPESKTAEPKTAEPKNGETRTTEPKNAEPTPAEAEREAPPREIAALPREVPASPREPTGPATRPPGSLAWQRNAVPVRDPGGRPMIAVMFDDVGVNRGHARKTVQLRGPLTLSFMSYAEDLSALTTSARAAGHELMLHLPMEPQGSRISPGPEALLVSLGDEEINRRTEWALNRFEGLVGVNNHMGSRFTADRRGMTLVLAQIKARGLLFVDSMTTPKSVGGSVASQLGVPHAERDVFLDHVQDRGHVRASLSKLEERARAKGYAIGIGHPHEETLDEVRPWLATLESRGFVLVPVSAIVRRLRDGSAVARADAATRLVRAAEPAASAVR
jgi:uncharacterized protein